MIDLTNMKIKLKILRCDPMSKEGCEPFLQAYDIEAKKGMTILDALHFIKDEQDGTLAFRRSCRSAICGSCAVNLNGTPKLACNTQLIPEYEKSGAIVIEPLANHRIIKDLVVDFNPFWEKMNKIEPWLNQKENTTREGQVRKEDILKINNSSKCIMCGCCNGACNSLEIDRHFIAPAALAKAWRFVGDAREKQKKKRFEKLSEAHGMWDCVRCISCTEYCPKDVAPLQAIERLRAGAIKEGITDNDGARHVESMVDSVKRVGRLDEAAITFKTLGFLRSIGMIPFGLRMEMHGKMPMPLIFPQIEKIEEVKKIYEEVEKKRRKETVSGQQADS
ncbi:MAG TPA: succinate dehydrogenase/fumarate reductase iron-sulfur subunit [Thermodesulfobacteriota bacterium]|nr:succinate dehydrogenase/fumarate reductase iron-sulfur subunit [Thermodesulfobacteriota bacterium]